MPKHKDGWLVQYSLKDSDDWRDIKTYDDLDHEPSELYLQSLRNELGNDYLVTAMRYEVGVFPRPVKIIRSEVNRMYSDIRVSFSDIEGVYDKSALPELPQAGVAAGGEDGGG